MKPGTLYPLKPYLFGKGVNLQGRSLIKYVLPPDPWNCVNEIAGKRKQTLSSFKAGGFYSPTDF